MSKTKFEVGNVKYVVRGGFHSLTPFGSKEAENIFDKYGGGVNGIIMELRGSQLFEGRTSSEGGRSMKNALEGIVEGELQRESKGLMDYAFDREIPVYVLEPEVRNGEEYKVLMKGINNNLNKGFRKDPIHYLSLIKHAFSKGDVDEKFMKKMYEEFNSYSNCPTLGINRNSIWAKKVKEYVVPSLKKSLGKEPSLGLDIGAAHLGIKYDLLNDKKRDEVIEGIKGEHIEGYGDKFSYDGYKMGKVGQVYTAQRKNNHWNISEEDTGLF